MSYASVNVGTDSELRQDEASIPEIANNGGVADDSYPFEAMRLKTGDRLQVQLPARFSASRVIVRLIGYVQNLSLLITPPRDSNGLRITVEEGEALFVRVFSSQNAFAFPATVEKLIRLPFDYLHISFPQEVKGMTIRNAPRVKTKIICSFGQVLESETNLTGVLANLSAKGALLATRHGVLQKDDQIKLTFRLLIHGTEVLLNLAAVVRSCFTDETSTKAEAAYHGLEFVSLKASDTMALQSMVYQQIIEQPLAVV